MDNVLWFWWGWLQIRMDLKHLKTKNQKAAAKHKSETDNLQVGRHDCTVIGSCLCKHQHHRQTGTVLCADS